MMLDFVAWSRAFAKGGWENWTKDSSWPSGQLLSYAAKMTYKKYPLGKSLGR